MAVPLDFTTLNVTGRFELNKALSDDADPVLKEQGIGWVLRKAMGIANIYLEVKHYKDDDGVEHLSNILTVTGGIPGDKEQQVMDWKEVESKSRVFGSRINRSRRIKAEELETEFLSKGWTEDTDEHGLIQRHIESDTPRWTVNQTWGVAEIGGERRYVMRTHFTGPKGGILERRYVYDYLGPL